MNQTDIVQRGLYYSSCTGIRLRGIADCTLNWVEEHQLLDVSLWRKFVQEFRLQNDSANNGWRGEYWGKMMRGAVMVYEYTCRQELYDILTDTVRDLLTAQNADGSFSTYKTGNDFHHWDLWCRKYVMLGLEYYLEICTDTDLKQQILRTLCAHADAVLAKIGDEKDGKLPVTQTCKIYGGMNSASILEPMVRLYRLTGEQRYLQFAEHILSTGGCQHVNIFKMAYEDKVAPYAYGVNKAYEMMSCFEGLVEYYEATGNGYYRDAAVRFARKVMKTDVTVIGCCGTLGELFDHSAVRQTEKTEGILQETCVSVTWMKLCRRLFAISGDPAFLDAIERTYYNAYLSTLNTECCHARNHRLKFMMDAIPTIIPFDSYSPLIPGIRGEETGGAQLLADRTYYGCCACIASAGAALYPKSMLWKTKQGDLILANYESGELETVLPSGQEIRFLISGNYPAAGKIRIRLQMEHPESFCLALRIPSWSVNSRLTVQGTGYPASAGFCRMERVWSNGDILELELDWNIYVTKAPIYGEDTIYRLNWKTGACAPRKVFQSEESRYFVSFQQGPVVLALDNRSGRSPDLAVQPDGMFDTAVKFEQVAPQNVPYPCTVACRVQMQDESLLLTDYASVGRLWNETSKSTAWIPVAFDSAGTTRDV